MNSIVRSCDLACPVSLFSSLSDRWQWN